MSCRVLSSAKALADLARLDVYPRNERVEYARLADAGISGKGADLPFQRPAQFIYSLAGLRTRAQDSEARFRKRRVQCIARVDVRLVYAQHELTVSFGCDN